MLKWFGDKFSQKKLLRDESGQGMTEYIVILALIVAAGIFIVAAFGDVIKAKYCQVSNTLLGRSVNCNPDTAVGGVNSSTTETTTRQRGNF